MIEKTKAQFMAAKDVKAENGIWNHTYLFGGEEELKDKFVFCFFGDMEIDGNLNLEWECWPGGRSLNDEFFERYNIQKGYVLIKYNPIEVNGKEIENPVKKSGIAIGDTIHTVNGYPILTTSNDIILAGSPKSVEVTYMHLGELLTTTLEPCYEEGCPKFGANFRHLPGKDNAIHGCFGICVLGNLKVNGSIVNRNCDGGPMLFVSGNVEADNLIVGGAPVIVNGATTLKNYLYAYYNHGGVCFGDVSAKAVIVDDHFGDFGKITGDFVRDGEPDADAEPSEYLSPEFEGNYDKIITAMLAGKDVRARKK